MIYRRPQNFDECVSAISALEAFDVPPNGPRHQLQTCAKKLIEIGWFEEGMRPLYDANEVVKLVMNSLVPVYQQLVLDDTMLSSAIESTPKHRQKLYQAEFDDTNKALVSACKTNTDRAVTERFKKMRTAMLRHAENEEVNASMQMLFVHFKSARFALRLVNERLVTSLSSDSDIVKSCDVPLDALCL